MMKRLFMLLLALALFLPCAQAEDFVGQSYSVGGSDYRLTLLWPSGEEAPAWREALQDHFFRSYPQMREIYGTTDVVEVTVLFCHMPDTVAYTQDSEIFISIEYAQQHPEDSGLFVHEMFHVVQNGYRSDAPEAAALTEGMADYARARFGADDPLWALEAYADGQSYMDSYRVTGAFLRYVADTWGERVLIRLNRLLHEGRYSADIWTSCTGMTLDALWQDYASSGR